MKLTRILPRRIAIAWQEYDLGKIERLLEYHKHMYQVFEWAANEGRNELEWLRRVNES